MDKKQAYLDKLRGQMREWDAKIDLMKAKMDKASAEAKLEYVKKLNTLNEKRRVAQQKFDKLVDSSEDTWETVSKDIEVAWNDMKGTISKFFSKDDSQGKKNA